MASQQPKHDSKCQWISLASRLTPLFTADVDNAQELTNLVQSMLQQMQTKFGEMNNNIVDRIDEMGRKIDELESSIGELVQEAQNESDGPAA